MPSTFTVGALSRYVIVRLNTSASIDSHVLAAKLLYFFCGWYPSSPPLVHHAMYALLYHHCCIAYRCPAVLIGTFKPKPKPKSTVPRGTSASVPVSTSIPAAPGKKPIGALVKEMKFDLSLLRTSLILDFLSHVLVSAMPEGTTAGFFVGATSLSSLGAGVIPAANSFALCVLQARGEDGAGKLFGALSVLQAVGQMIIGVSGCVFVCGLGAAVC